jgi:peptidoglycan/xylan/chitin deacetylase (PgdA/CDA1 family)
MSSLFMRFPGHKAKALTLSYDDGVEQDIRLISILKKHGIKCTFNINSGIFSPEGTIFPEGQIHRRLSEKAVVDLYKDSGHEVAVHGLTHPFLEQLPSNIASYEITQDRRNLEKLFGTIIRGMAYPFGTFSDEVVAVLKACGIVYSRTVMDTEDFRLPTDWLRLPATCHHNNPRLNELVDRFVTEKPRWAPWLFYLWGHSYEFEADDNWNIIEDFCAKVGGRDDIWYATNIEIYDYMNAHNQLQFSVDASMVHNPTSTTLFFEYNEQSYELAPGATLHLSTSAH